MNERIVRGAGSKREISVIEKKKKKKKNNSINYHVIWTGKEDGEREGERKIYNPSE